MLRRRFVERGEWACRRSSEGGWRVCAGCGVRFARCAGVRVCGCAMDVQWVRRGRFAALIESFVRRRALRRPPLGALDWAAERQQGWHADGALCGAGNVGGRFRFAAQVADRVELASGKS